MEEFLEPDNKGNRSPLEKDDSLGNQEWYHMSQRGGKNDIPHSLEIRQTCRISSHYLSFSHGLNPRPDYFRKIGSIENHKGNEDRYKIA